jgi:hypothetical protein
MAISTTKMKHIAALLYYFSIVIIETTVGESTIKTLLRSAAPGLHVSDQDIKTCAELHLEKDCHSEAVEGRCVFCPDVSSMMLDMEEDGKESRGSCYPAAIYGIACPRERRRV